MTFHNHIQLIKLTYSCCSSYIASEIISHDLYLVSWILIHDSKMPWSWKDSRLSMDGHELWINHGWLSMVTNIACSCSSLFLILWFFVCYYVVNFRNMKERSKIHGPVKLQIYHEEHKKRKLELKEITFYLALVIRQVANHYSGFWFFWCVKLQKRFSSDPVKHF